MKFSFHELAEKSMPTAVNYDKYRDCDAPILEDSSRVCAPCAAATRVAYTRHQPRHHFRSTSDNSLYVTKNAADLSATTGIP